MCEVCLLFPPGAGDVEYALTPAHTPAPHLFSKNSYVVLESSESMRTLLLGPFHKTFAINGSVLKSSLLSQYLLSNVGVPGVVADFCNPST